jgi:hypothetical protein
MNRHLAGLPGQPPQHPKIKAFREWIVAAVAADRARAEPQSPGTRKYDAAEPFVQASTSKT